MSRAIAWVKVLAWLVSRKSSSSERFASRWKREALVAMRELARVESSVRKERARFEEALGRFERRVSEAEGKLEATRDAFRKYELAEEALSNEIELYRDLRLPGLRLANEEMQQQVETLIALNAFRQETMGARKEQ